MSIRQILQLNKDAGTVRQTFDFPQMLLFVENQITFLSDARKAEIKNKLTLDKANLENALAECASWIYYYGIKANEVEQNIKLLELVMEVKAARFLKDFRLVNEKMAYKEKEADIRRMLIVDDEYFSLKKLLSSLELLLNEFSTIVKSFEAQSRLLLSANKRDLFQTTF